MNILLGFVLCLDFIMGGGIAVYGYQTTDPLFFTLGCIMVILSVLGAAILAGNMRHSNQKGDEEGLIQDLADRLGPHATNTLTASEHTSVAAFF
jgi:hypothetical protein